MPLAKCGHQGEAIIGQYVMCPTCDGVPEHVESEITEKICLHNARMVWHGTLSCCDCGKILGFVK